MAASPPAALLLRQHRRRRRPCTAASTAQEVERGKRLDAGRPPRPRWRRQHRISAMSRLVYRPERPQPQPARQAPAAYLRPRDAGRRGGGLPRAGRRARPRDPLPPVNREYEIIDWIHEARETAGGIVINPAAFTHTSVAILDALNTFEGPVIEVHISNVHKREASATTPMSRCAPTASSPGSARRAICWRCGGSPG